MRRLEARFGKPHPELQDVGPLCPQLVWLLNSFFRLHRRRSYSQHGRPLPLAHAEIADFADRTIQLPGDLRQFFSRAMEEVDDGVLEDYYARAAREDAEQDRQARQGRRRR